MFRTYIACHACFPRQSQRYRCLCRIAVKRCGQRSVWTSDGNRIKSRLRNSPHFSNGSGEAATPHLDCRSCCSSSSSSTHYSVDIVFHFHDNGGGNTLHTSPMAPPRSPPSQHHAPKLHPLRTRSRDEVAQNNSHLRRPHAADKLPPQHHARRLLPLHSTPGSPASHLIRSTTASNPPPSGLLRTD